MAHMFEDGAEQSTSINFTTLYSLTIRVTVDYKNGGLCENEYKGTCFQKICDFQTVACALRM